MPSGHYKDGEDYDLGCAPLDKYFCVSVRVPQLDNTDSSSDGPQASQNVVTPCLGVFSLTEMTAWFP